MGSASVEDGLKCALHLFRHLEHNNLPRAFGISVRNTEDVPVLACLEKCDGDRGQNAQMSRYLFRVFMGLDCGVWDRRLPACVLECEGRIASHIETAESPRAEAGNGAASVLHVHIICCKGSQTQKQEQRNRPESLQAAPPQVWLETA